jgi:hypothetical protein
MSTNDRNHEVRLLMDHLAIGGTLTPEDLEALRLPADIDRSRVEREIRAAASAITAARRTGHREPARRIAREEAARIIHMTGDLLPPKAPDMPTDPAALARLIPR